MKKFIPTHCTYCKHKLEVTLSKDEKYKLICPNTECCGVALRKFQKGMLAFGIAGLGPANLESLFNAGIKNIYDLVNATESQLIDSGEFKKGRALEKIMTAVSSINSIELDKLILSMQFDKVGHSISKEIANYMTEHEYSFDGFDYTVRDEITNPESEMNIKINQMVEKLKTIGVNIIKKEKSLKMDENMKAIIVEMTGSPKEFGFKTKEEFLDVVSPFGVIHGKLDKNCNYLVTDDISSKTSKMAKASKLGVKIVTYSELIDIVKK